MPSIIDHPLVLVVSSWNADRKKPIADHDASTSSGRGPWIVQLRDQSRQEICAPITVKAMTIAGRPFGFTLPAPYERD